MIASERRVTAATNAAANGIKLKQHQILKPGRAVKIYVIDPRKFQERLEKYVGDLKQSEPNATTTKGKDAGSSERIKNNSLLVQNKIDEKRQKLSTDNTLSIGSSNTNNTITIVDVESDVEVQKEDNGQVKKSTTLSELPNDKPKPNHKKKAVKKRKIVAKAPRRGSNVEEKAEAAELAYLMKETTTRTGRVSKSSTATAAAAIASSSASVPIVGISQPASPTGSVFSLGLNSSAPSPSPSVASVNSQGQTQRTKKREPPEMFRCQTCLKVYLGHTKLNLHFQKFPTHQKSDAPPVLSKKKKTTVVKQSATTLENVNIINSSSSIITENLSTLSSFFPIQQQVPIITNTQNTVEIQTDPIPLEVNYNQHQNVDQGLINSFRSISSEKGKRCTSTINADILSDNCSSPKLSNFPLSTERDRDTSVTVTEGLYNHVSTTMDPIFIQTESNLQPVVVAEPDLSSCLSSSDLEERSTRNTNDEYFMEFQSDFNAHTEISQIPSELIGNGSCSQQSFNSLENLLADSNSQILHPSPQPSPTGTGGHNITTKRRTTFFPSSDERGREVEEEERHNSILNSSYANNGSINSIAPPLVVDEESRDICIINNRNIVTMSENSLDGIVEPPLQQPSLLKRKSIWEFVKEQIRLCGINQACGEISEMADKLSKVARDKFYPIREEEVERLGNSPPVIHVDTPFISHLLDLPFGTYIFKEDGGIRKIIPPPTPVSSDLSLTGGVEVDIDKFLSPDIDDLISLPHLTNLDFSSICNN